MTDLSRKEQVLQLICANPFISQQELAERCGLSRSAVAGHISSLIRERRLLGRAYVFPGQRQVVCIGGANLDRKMQTLGPFIMGSSNPVSQYESYGGVARNIAENLVRLSSDDKVVLLSAFGKDGAGQAMQAHARQLGIDTASSLQLEGSSDSYTAVLDAGGEMLLALAHMQLVEQLSPAFLAGSQNLRRNAALVLADLNLPAPSLELLLQDAQHSAVPLLLVAVSQAKMARLPQDLRGLRLLLLNRGELAARLGVADLAEADLAPACAKLQEQGAQDVIVTLGAQGVCHTSAEGLQFLRARSDLAVQDVTGAGDAFAAAVAWSLLRAADDLHLACQRGLTLAALTLQCAATVCPQIDAHQLLAENLLLD